MIEPTYIITAENDPDVWRGAYVAPFDYWRYCSMICRLFNTPLPPPFRQWQLQIGAVVNHGRWLVTCPFCKLGQVVSVEKRLFWCPKCRMAKNDGLPMRVTVPLQRTLIEKILLMRPLENRNWRWGESPEQLARENLEHRSELRV